MTTLSIRGNPLLADHYSPAEGRYSVPSGFEAKKKGPGPCPAPGHPLGSAKLGDPMDMRLRRIPLRIGT
jgi:hypothetical protein